MEKVILLLVLAASLAFGQISSFPSGSGGGGGGTGDVVGPASATDSALVIYDGITGKLLKNSECRYTGDKSIACGDGTVPGGIGLYELAANGSDGFFLTVPDALSAPICLYPKSGMSMTSGKVLTLTGASASRTIDGGSYTCYEMDFETPAAGGGGGFLDMYGALGTIPSSTEYYLITGYVGLLANESVRTTIPAAATATSIGVFLFTAQHSSGPIVCTLRRGTGGSLSDTSLAVTIPLSSGAATSHTATGSVALSAGDQITVSCDNQATSTSGAIGSVVIGF